MAGEHTNKRIRLTTEEENDMSLDSTSVHQSGEMVELGNENDWEADSIKPGDCDESKETLPFEGDQRLTSAFANDQYKYTRLLPEDGWYMIFDKLEEQGDSESLKNLINTSLYFRHLLLSRRTNFLFAEMWNILGKKYEELVSAEYKEDKQFGVTDEENSVQVCQACGRQRQVCWYSGILKLRLVCKTWSKAVDNFYQQPRQDFYSKKDSAMEYVGSFGHWTVSSFTLFTPETVHQFHRHFEKTHKGTNRSPFISKFVDFEDVNGRANDDEKRHFMDGLQDALSIYGRHVLTFSIYQVSSPTAYMTLRDLLGKMPKLAVLDTQYQYEERPLVPLPAQQLALEMETINFHPIPKLEFLDYFDFHDLPESTLNGILRSNSHISKLCIPFWHPQKYDSLFSVPLPNLTQVRCAFEFDSDFLETIADPRITWPLTKLRLMITDRCTYTGLSQVFSVLQDKWTDTLTELILIIKTPMEDAGLPNWNLHLKKLQKLTLETPALPLNFVYQMKDTLEYLDIIWLVHTKKNTEARSSSAVKERKTFTFLEEEVYIFRTKLPKLKHFAFKSKCPED